jgi:hypothetical protein
MSRKFSSVSLETDVVGSLTTVATSIDVVSASNLLGGINDADVSASNDFIVVIDPETSNEEIVKVTAVSGNTLTVTRGYDGSTAKTHTSGAKVRHMAIGEDLRLAAAHRAASAAVHGLSGTVVGTTDTQTLTNKTLYDPVITGTATNNGTITGGVINAAELQVAGDDVVTEDGTQTLTNKTIASPSITGDVSIGVGGRIFFEGSTDDAFETRLEALNPTSDRIIYLPDRGGTVITTGDYGTVTSTMISDGTINNVDINSSAAIAASKIAGTAVTRADSGTVTSAMIADGTIVNADINASAAIAPTKIDGTAATLLGTQTLYNKTLSSPTINTPTVSYPTVTGGSLNSVSLASDLAAGGYKVTGLGAPSASADAATKNYVDTAVSNLLDSAPGALDTLNELAAALGDDPNFSTTITNSIATKLALAGGTMTGAIDMGSNKITTLGTPTASTDATTKAYVDGILGSATDAATSAAAAAASYDAFDDRYLGSKGSDPAVDNDGDALITGALYWNSTDNVLKVYGGASWYVSRGLIICTSATQPAHSEGQLIYETDTDLVKVSDGSTWNEISGGGASVSYQDSAPTAEAVGELWVDSDATASALNTNDFVQKTDIYSEAIHPFVLMGA